MMKTDDKKLWVTCDMLRWHTYQYTVIIWLIYQVYSIVFEIRFHLRSISVFNRKCHLEYSSTRQSLSYIDTDILRERQADGHTDKVILILSKTWFVWGITNLIKICLQKYVHTIELNLYYTKHIMTIIVLIK